MILEKEEPVSLQLFDTLICDYMCERVRTGGSRDKNNESFILSSYKFAFV